MPRIVRRGHAIGALVLGVMELVIALIIIICSFVLAGKASMDKKVTPYWSGIPFIIPGILGVVIGITKNNCAMIAFMILNIICFVIQGISTILVAIVLAIWATLAKDWSSKCTVYGNSCVCSGRTIHGISGSSCKVLKDISVLLYVIVLFLIVSALVTLGASILGCIAVCCSNDNQPGTVIVQQPGNVMMTTHAPPPTYYQPGEPIPVKQ